MSELDDLRQSLRKLGRRLAEGEIDAATFDQARERLLADLTPAERAALSTGIPGTPSPGTTPAPATPLPVGPAGPSGGSGRGMATRLPQLAELKLSPGDELAGRWRIERELGRGGFGVVFLARDLRLDKMQAVKVLDPSMVARPDLLSRFRREVALTRDLVHPRIVRVFEYVEEANDGLALFSMEHVKGSSVRLLLEAARLRKVPIPLALSLWILGQVLEALEAAHAAGVIHRDVTPANILLAGGTSPELLAEVERDPQVKLVDFGIAGAIERSELSQKSRVLGTAAYVAPEVLDPNGDVTPAADVYGAGAVFYELVTGRLPLGRFEDPSAVREGVGKAVDELALALLRQDPRRRPAVAAARRAAGEARQALEPVAAPPKPVPLSAPVPSPAPPPLPTSPPASPRFTVQEAAVVENASAGAPPREPAPVPSVRRPARLLLGGALFLLIAFVALELLRGHWGVFPAALSEKTTGTLKNLKAPVNVTVFMAQGSPLLSATLDLLRRYRAVSPMVSVESIDPARDTAGAEKLTKEFGLSAGSGAVVFRSAENRKCIDEFRLAELDSSAGGEPKVKAFNGEGEFTYAILSVTESKAARVLFTAGHGERKLEELGKEGFSTVAGILHRDNCTVEDWRSLGAKEVPAGTDLVVVAGPRTGFTFPETDALKAYLAEGGRALLLLDPEFSPGGGNRMVDLGLGPVLDAFGVRLGNDIVVDPKNALPLMGPETVVARSFRSHTVTKLLEGLPVVFPVIRSVGLVEKLPAGVTATILIETSAEGWGETNLADLETKVEKDDKDVAGPVPLAVAAETTGTGAVKKARIVVVGDADFASTGGIANAANLYLLTSSVNWLLDRESLVSIPPKSTDQVAVVLSRGDIFGIMIFVLLVLPACAIGLGIVVWLKRRR